MTLQDPVSAMHNTGYQSCATSVQKEDFREEKAMHIVYVMCGAERSHEFLASVKSLHLFAKVALNADQNYYHIHVITADTVSFFLQSSPLHVIILVYICTASQKFLPFYSCCLCLAAFQYTQKVLLNLYLESCIPAEWCRGGWWTAATKQFQAHISQNGHGGSGAIWSLCNAGPVYT